jgi:hypothetical protein
MRRLVEALRPPAVTADELERLAGWWGRGKGNADDPGLAALIRDLGRRVKMRPQKALFRGLSLPNGVFDPRNTEQVLGYVRGLRSWSRDKRSANYYAKMPLHHGADSVLFVWESPNPSDLVLDAGSLDAAAKKLGLRDSRLDTSEVIADPKSVRVVGVATDYLGQGSVEVEPGKWKKAPVSYHTVTIA